MPAACDIERRSTTPLVCGYVICCRHAARYPVGSASPKHDVFAIPRIRRRATSAVPADFLWRAVATRACIDPQNNDAHSRTRVAASSAIGVRDLSVDSTVPTDRSTAGTTCTRTTSDAALAATNAARAPVRAARTRAGRGLATRRAGFTCSSALTGPSTSHACSAALRGAPALACGSSAATRAISREVLDAAVDDAGRPDNGDTPEPESFSHCDPSIRAPDSHRAQVSSLATLMPMKSWRVWTRYRAIPALLRAVNPHRCPAVVLIEVARTPSAESA